MGNCLQSGNNSNKSQNGNISVADGESTRELNDGGSTKSLTDSGSKKKKFQRRTSAHNGIMQAIAIKFPHIKRSFLACKTVYDKYCTRDEEDETYVHKSEVRKLLIELGAREKDLTDDEVDRIIKTANLDGDEKIDFKEFLIAAAVGCFLGHDATGQSEEFLAIRRGFAVAEEAFQKIDKDGSGEIDFEELKTAFLAMRQDDLVCPFLFSPKTKEKNNKKRFWDSSFFLFRFILHVLFFIFVCVCALLCLCLCVVQILERLKELDFNGDKTVEFPEFVWGISAWVGMDEADEADETDVQSDMNIQKNAEHTADIQAINKQLTQDLGNES